MTVLRRRPGIASVAVLAGITVALATAHAVAPEWSRAAGLDVWNIPAAEAERRELEDRRDDLEAVHAQLRVRVAAADHLSTQLIDGRARLADAADEVVWLNRDRDAFFRVLRLDHPSARTERELAARYLISKVADRFYDDPSGRAEATDRLEAEYRRLCGQ
jgi:hypothetical protein